MSVVVQSIQTELTHLLSSSRVLLHTPNNSKYIILIPIIFHIIRYSKTKNLKKSIDLGYKENILLHIINWCIVLNHEKTEYTILLAIISGTISLYNVYNNYKLEKKEKVENNYLVDIFMICLALYLMIDNYGDPHAQFIGIRELVYHLMEWVIIY